MSEPKRRQLPDTRKSITHAFNISGHKGYLTVGLYEDGTPGELFITMAKEGSTIRGMADTIGILTSMALQYGLPIASLARKFDGVKFEPMGNTKNSDIPETSSISDYIFRWMGLRFCPEFAEEVRVREEAKAKAMKK